MNNDVIYITKSDIVPAMFAHWLATMIRSKVYKSQNREPFQTMIVLHGSSGIGKTAIMKGFIEKHLAAFGNHFAGGVVKINIPAMAGEDFEVPFANSEKATVEKLSAISLPLSPCVIQADEINRYQTVEAVNSFTRIMLDGDGTVTVPNGSLIVGCANSTSYAGAKRFPDHLVSRAVHVYISENEDAARLANEDYIRLQGLPNYAVECFKLSPTESKNDFREIAEYNMRSYEFACYLCKAVDELNASGIEVSEYVLRALVCGAIGCNQGNKLMKCRAMAKLPTLGEIINDPAKAQIPDVDLDAALRRKYTDKLIEACDTKHKADKLAQYLARMGAEFARFSIEKLSEKFTNVKPERYMQWDETSPR